MSDQSKEKLRNEFNKIDSDGNGSLSIEELTVFSKTVSPKITKKDIDKIFKFMDIDGNGKITFEEFYEWWENKENKLLPLLYIKQNIQKSLAQAEKTIAQPNAGTSTKGNTLQQFKVSFKIGDSPCKSEFGLKVSTHIQSLELSKPVRDVIGLKENQPCLVLKYKVSKDQQKAKEIFTDIIQQAREILETILPPQYNELILDNLDIKVETFEKEYLLLSFSSEHSMIQAILQQYSGLVDHINVGDQSGVIDFSIKNSLDLKELLDSSNPDIISQLAKGFNFCVDVRASKILLNLLRKIYFDKVLKQHKDGDGYISSKRKAERFFAILGCLINGISISAEEKDLSDYFKPTQQDQKMIDKIISEARSKGNPQSIISKIPIIQDFIDFFLNHFEPQIEILLIAPGIFAELKLKITNFHVAYQKIFNP